MLTKVIGAVFAPKHPRGYTGRHRAAAADMPDKPAVTPAGAPTN